MKIDSVTTLGDFPSSLAVTDTQDATSSQSKQRSQPSVAYRVIEDDDGKIDLAFDILFEETLKQIDDLTTGDI